LLDLNLLSENYYSEEQINIKVLSGALQYDWQQNDKKEPFFSLSSQKIDSPSTPRIQTAA
jgi:hypothetical protein